MLLEAYHRQQLGLNQTATGNGIIAWCVVMTTWCLQRPGWLRESQRCVVYEQHEELEGQKTSFKNLKNMFGKSHKTAAASITPYISIQFASTAQLRRSCRPWDWQPLSRSFFSWFGVGTIEPLKIPGLLGIMITHGRETYQPTSIMRWDRGIFNGSIAFKTFAIAT